MNKIKKIALIAILSLAFTNCKKEETTSKEALPVETKADSTETTNAVAKLETTNFSIEGMTCEMGCAKVIESKLTNLDGVREAKVDFENKTATVSFDSNKQNTTNIVKTVEAVAGGDTYKVSKIKLFSRKNIKAKPLKA